MKLKPKKRELNALLRLVNLWFSARGRKRKALMLKLSAANERFYARWKQDGVATLFREHAGRMK